MHQENKGWWLALTSKQHTNSIPRILICWQSAEHAVVAQRQKHRRIEPLGYTQMRKMHNAVADHVRGKAHNQRQRTNPATVKALEEVNSAAAWEVVELRKHGVPWARLQESTSVRHGTAFHDRGNIALYIDQTSVFRGSWDLAREVSPVGLRTPLL